MFELPEVVTLARQINETFTGKIIRTGSLGNSPHKFVWYNRSHEEFERLTKGKFLTAFTRMWGAMELYESGQEQERELVKGMKTTPIEPGFSFEYFSTLIDSLLEGGKRSVKGFLMQDQIIPGLGNAIAHDILFRAGLHPKHPVSELSKEQRQKLYDAILKTVHQVISKGGRYDEYDLYNHRGKYIRIMDGKAVGNPCPACGSKIEQTRYLGGACYFCPHCQE